jgi:hypothetical protein
VLLFASSTFFYSGQSLVIPYQQRRQKREIHWFTVKSTKETTHAFIIRIWIEHRERNDVEPLWRGVIEHVEDGERVYFDHLDKMSSYFVEHLEAIGIKIDKLGR